MSTGKRGDRRWWRSLSSDQSGAAAVVFALTVPTMIGLVGMGVEAGLWYQIKRQAQTASDAAALAAAIEYSRRGSVSEAVTAAAEADAARNGFAQGGDTQVAVAEVEGKPGQVAVTVSRRRSPLFSSLFRDEPVTIAARAVAGISPDGQACVLALDPARSGAVTFQGNPTVQLDGCLIAANSNSDSAINVAGNASVTADSLWTVGNYNEQGSVSLDLARAPVTGAWALPDPYAGVTMPAAAQGACAHTSLPKAPKTGATELQPGVWCVDWDLKGKIALKAGTYYLRDSSITANAQAQVYCSNCTAPGSGVTLVLTGAAPGSVRINGGAEIALKAPGKASGEPFPGLLLVQDRRASGGGLTINGNPDLTLDGALYFPAQNVDVSGTASASAQKGCLHVVAKTVRFMGNAGLDNRGCKDQDVASIPTVAAMLVE